MNEMVSLNDLRQKREDLLRIAEKHGAHNVRVFGSVARGETSESSDLDILVQMDDDRSLIDHVALIRDLKNLLKSEVHVVPEAALHRAIRGDVLREAVAI